MNPIFAGLPTTVFERMSARARETGAINLGQGFPEIDGPADIREATRSLTDWSFVRDGDGSVVGAPIDWLGENYYTVLRVGIMHSVRVIGTPNPSTILLLARGLGAHTERLVRDVASRVVTLDGGRITHDTSGEAA